MGARFEVREVKRSGVRWTIHDSETGRDAGFFPVRARAESLARLFNEKVAPAAAAEPAGGSDFDARR